MDDDKFELGKHQFSEEEIAEMMSPALREKKEQERKHQAFIQAALSDDLEDNAGPYQLRCIIENEKWYVPLKDNGNFEILNVRKEEHARLIAGASKQDGRRTVRAGKGGQLLPIYRQRREGQFAEFDGRMLVRSLPGGISGLLVEEKVDEPLRELYTDYFDELKAVADAFDIERVLCAPGPIDTARLREYPFRVAMYKKDFWIHDDVISISTHSDKDFFDDDCTVDAINGADLFVRALENPYCLGIRINRAHELGVDAEEICGLLLSPNFIKRAQTETRCLLRAPEYVVRSREEFKLWLDMALFPKERETFEEKTEDGRTILYAVAKTLESDGDERECEQRRDGSPAAVSPRFEMNEAPGSPDEIGAGPSKVLCPAMLAMRLFYQVEPDNRRLNLWNPGKNVLLGRLLSDKDLRDSHERVVIANELLKLIPPGADKIPRDALLSIKPTRVFSWAPNSWNRAWAEEALAQGRKYSKKFVPK